MSIMNNVALVLEGGGMRGMFSAGVFEAFLQKNIDFPYCVAISAGACNVVSYLAHQPLRTRKIITDYVTDPRYCSLGNMLRKRSMFDFDFILREIPHSLLPFDYENFNKSTCNFLTGATDCNTGESVWFPKEAMGEDFEPLRASASLPFISPIVKLQGRKLLDGGMASPIPIDKALADGYEKFVVVLTQNFGYRKTETFPNWLLKLCYGQYPKLVERLRDRAKRYNEQLELVEQLEKEGKAIVIRPLEPLKIKRMDRKPQLLLELHDHGTECGLACTEQIVALAVQPRS